MLTTILINSFPVPQLKRFIQVSVSYEFKVYLRVDFQLRRRLLKIVGFSVLPEKTSVVRWKKEPVTWRSSLFHGEGVGFICITPFIVSHPFKVKRFRRFRFIYNDKENSPRKDSLRDWRYIFLFVLTIKFTIKLSWLC